MKQFAVCTAFVLSILGAQAQPSAKALMLDKLKCVYVSCGEGVIDVIEQRDPDHYELRERIQTRSGARTSLFPAELNQFYLAVPKRGDQEAEIRVYQPQN